VDDIAIGRLFRGLRLRLGWRQLDVSAKSEIARSTYSAIERGHFDRIPLATLRRVATVLDVRLPLEPSWRGGGIERVISGRHAAMAERVSSMIVAAGWEVRPEASFNHFGERGVVDLVAWHAERQTLLLVEIKTELVDPSGLLAVTDRRRRLAHVIAHDSGWKPNVIAQWVVLANGRTNERRVADHRSLLRAAFPNDGRSIASWLADPRTPLDALWFLPDVADRSTGRAVRGPRRVSTRSRKLL
jgi:transcriptional regulator with XRE-family HTH domain